MLKYMWQMDGMCINAFIMCSIRLNLPFANNGNICIIREHRFMHADASLGTWSNCLNVTWFDLTESNLLRYQKYYKLKMNHNHPWMVCITEWQSTHQYKRMHVFWNACLFAGTSVQANPSLLNILLVFKFWVLNEFWKVLNFTKSDANMDQSLWLLNVIESTLRWDQFYDSIGRFKWLDKWILYIFH